MAEYLFLVGLVSEVNEHKGHSEFERGLGWLVV